MNISNRKKPKKTAVTAAANDNIARGSYKLTCFTSCFSFRFSMIEQRLLIRETSRYVQRFARGLARTTLRAVNTTCGYSRFGSSNLLLMNEFDRETRSKDPCSAHNLTELSTAVTQNRQRRIQTKDK